MYHHFLIVLSLFVTLSAYGKTENSRRDSIQTILAPYFTPPSQYANLFGKYRNPLLFYDGTPVKNKSDWALRRKEIRRRWMELMGNWPPLEEKNEMRILDTVHETSYIRHRVRFRWAPNEDTEGYLLLPYSCIGSHKNTPAIITVFYEPETSIGIGGKPYRDFGKQLAQRGFIVLSIGTTRSSQEKTYSIFYPEIHNATVEPLSMLACAAANAFNTLATRQEVDPHRIGIMGHSFGGKWAMFASCLYDRFACAAWSDPGIVFDESKPAVNYWEPYYLGYTSPPWRKRGNISPDNPASGLYPQLIQQGYDLHELHALMAPRPFLVSGGSCDPAERWIPLNHTIAINTFLGYSNRVAMTNRPLHAPNAESNQIIYLFFEYFLKPQR